MIIDMIIDIIMEFKIPLRNQKKEIVGYTLVSKIDYEHLTKYKWHMNKQGRVQGRINNKLWFIHRYICLEILIIKISDGYVIDHIDNNPLNNCRENLRLATFSENSRNRKKNPDCVSKYMGVSYDTKAKLWRTNLRIDGNRLYASYTSEIHAAHQYNLWCKEYNLLSDLNLIDEPMDFILYQNKKDLPKGVQRRNTKFVANISINGKNKHIGTFATIESAEEAYKQAKQQLKDKKEEIVRQMPMPITRNDDGLCVMFIFNKSKEKVGETLVDEELFHSLQMFSWSFSHGYVQGTVNNKDIALSRYIMNYTGKDIVDHINNNPLDNRKENLRIITRQQNVMNQSVQLNKTSKFIGVTWDKERKKWSASLQINSVRKHLGRFTDEIEAAKARDQATIQYFGEFGNLNFKDQD